MASPVFNEKTMSKLGSGAIVDTQSMTVAGAINKTGLLFLILCASAAFSWSQAGTPISSVLLMTGVIGGLVCAMVLAFNPTKAAFLAPAYAVLEGLALGTISAMYDYRYPGIVSNAMIGTLSVTGLMLGLYRFRILQATPRFQKAVTIATLAIFVTYMVDMVMGLFSHPMPMLHQGTPLGIGLSVVIIGVAAMNLIMDFDLIERSARNRTPRVYEWYCGFGVMVTLVWMYMEILRLLGNMNRK